MSLKVGYKVRFKDTDMVGTVNYIVSSEPLAGFVGVRWELGGSSLCNPDKLVVINKAAVEGSQEYADLWDSNE